MIYRNTLHQLLVLLGVGDFIMKENSMPKAPQSPTPPTAMRKSHSFSHHGDTVQDPYFWLKDSGYPDVTDSDILAYLEEENAYYESVTKLDQPLIDEVFDEIKGRIPEEDQGVPYQSGKYDFRWRFETGAQYRVWQYRPRTDDPFSGEDWKTLFDENARAEGHDYFRLARLAVSPDGKLLAAATDTNGSERFTIRLYDLATGEVLDHSIEDVSGEIIWTRDSSAFYYVEVSKEWRPYKIWRFTLKNAQKTQIFEEKDTGFFVHISETSSESYMVIRSADHVTAGNHIVALDKHDDEPMPFGTRRHRHDFHIDHAGGRFWIRSNKDHENYGLYSAEAPTDEKTWLQHQVGTDQRYIHGMQAFDTFVVLEDRVDGLDQITILNHQGNAVHVPFNEAVYEVGLDNNTEVNQGFIRLGFTSLLTPATIMDVPVSADGVPGEPNVRKVQTVPSGYNRDGYRSERILVTVRDGTSVPVSLVYSKEWQKDAGAPLHLYGYGAYGLGMSPAFSAARLSLLDRGFVYAIAHIRGGDELGQGWYEAGKLERRTNTFNDFVDVAKYLSTTGYAALGGISISGGSAGGELMGAVVNQAPDLFKAAVLHVPFVDVLNTMLDADLPLTPLEWPEWGNPIQDVDAYNVIKSYCPYTNIEAKAYPSMMVTGGLNDPRVTYWEPAKWTAKMRSLKTDDNLLVMKINMGAGHGGKSGRFERYREVAEEYVFLLNAFKETR
jgi:oligopeptidase B